jgi:uncharacterized protein YecE (DUF72 family)
MNFGKIENPDEIDFTLPEDHPDTKKNLVAGSNKPFEVFVGCAKWNKQDLKGFYPRGTKDELAYYATQFNSIELNATFYKTPSPDQVQVWKEKTAPEFKFYPKVNNTISHFRRLNNVQDKVAEFCDAISNFEDRLGISFLQLHDNFKPQDYSRLESFVKEYPKVIPLAVELRNGEWFSDVLVTDKVFELFRSENTTPIIVDTAGRRDLLHMRLTSPKAFIRYVGANHASDYTRLDDWLERIEQWREGGLESLHFFVHQNIEKESPLLSAYFIEKLNKRFDMNIRVPKMG